MEVKRAEGEKKKKPRGLSYIAENDTKERYGTCDLQYSNSEKREYFAAEVLFLPRSRDRSFRNISSSCNSGIWEGETVRWKQTREPRR